MSTWDAAKFFSEYKNKEFTEELVKILENQTIPEDDADRLFPTGEGTPLGELKKRLRKTNATAPVEFDFELDEIITIDEAIRRCVEARVEMRDMLQQHCNRQFLNVNLDRNNPDWREISKPENANSLVELGRVRYLDEAKLVVDWKATLPQLKSLGHERKYTPEMMRVCLEKLVSDFLNTQTHMIEGMNANEIAKYLLSTESKRDTVEYRHGQLNMLIRRYGEELRIPLTKAKQLINMIYPETEAANALPRSILWRKAILSFLPDEVSVHLQKEIEDNMRACTPLSDDKIHQMALEADKASKIQFVEPLKFGRLIGSNQILLNSMDSGYGTYGMPLESYQDPYQAYAAYPALPDQRPNQPLNLQQQMFPPQAHRHLAAANAAQAARRTAAIRAAEQQRQRQAIEAAKQRRLMEAMASEASLQSPETAQAVPEGIARLLLRTPDHQAGSQNLGGSPGSPSLNEAADHPLMEAIRDLPDSVRRNILDAANKGEAGNMSGACGTSHDLNMTKVIEARAEAESHSGSPKGHDHETGVKTRSQSRGAKASQTAGEQSLYSASDLQLMALTMVEAITASKTRDRSKDLSLKRGEVRDGRYSSRERLEKNSQARPDSRNGDRGRPLSSSRGSWPPRDGPRRDSSAGYSRRSASKSPGRSYGGQKYSSEDRRGRSDSRGVRSGTSRPNSGQLRSHYPEMNEGVNCRMGYDPYREKHCTKCSRSAEEHHEFLCVKYDLYCPKLCSTCHKGNHFPKECRDRVETFPPQVAGESHPRAQSKN